MTRDLSIALRPFAIAAVILLAAPPLKTQVKQEHGFAVVVNRENTITNVPFVELRKIFAGDRRSWPGSRPIKLIMRSAGTPERNVVLQLLGMSEEEYEKHWAFQVYRGEAQSEPLTLASDDLQQKAVNTFPGAIAIVNVNEVKPDVKVVKVEEHMAGDDGYPLRD